MINHNFGEAASHPEFGLFRALTEVSLQLCQERPEDELAQKVIEILEETVGYEYGAVLVIDPSSRRLIPLSLSRQGRAIEFLMEDREYVLSHGLTVGQGITGWVAQTGQSVCTGDVRKDPRYVGVRSDIRSELCVPICSGDNILGVLNTETATLDAYTGHDLRLQEAVASQLSLAIQHSRLSREKWEEPVLKKLEPDELLRICAYCKNYMDENNEWAEIERYISRYMSIHFSHGVCPACYQQYVQPEVDRMRKDRLNR